MTRALPAALAIAAVFGLAACGQSTEAPEPANESTANQMPETPDMSETAEPAPTTAAPASGSAPAG